MNAFSEYLSKIDPYFSNQIKTSEAQRKRFEETKYCATYDTTKDCKECEENGWQAYKGERKNGLRHGKGKFEFMFDGSTYEGDWVDDKRHGFGKHTWVDDGPCLYYIGEYSDDRR